MKAHTSKTIANPDEFVWGAADIGKYLGRSKEATWFMLEHWLHRMLGARDETHETDAPPKTRSPDES